MRILKGESDLLALFDRENFYEAENELGLDFLLKVKDAYNKTVGWGFRPIWEQLNISTEGMDNEGN